MRTSQNVCSLRNTETLTQRHVYTFATLIAIKNLALKETLFTCKFGSLGSGVRWCHHLSLLFHSVEVRVCTEVRRCCYKTQNPALFTPPCSHGLPGKGPWSSGKSRFMVTSSILLSPLLFLSLWQFHQNNSQRTYLLFKFCQLATGQGFLIFRP